MIKRLLISVVVGCLLLISACAPSEILPEQGAATQEARQTPNIDHTLSPVPEQTTPLPTIGIIIPQEEADMIFEKVRTMIAEQIRVTAEEITLTEISPVEWPDGCLGLASPDEMCIQVITPGYRLLIEVNGNIIIEVRTDWSGNQVRVSQGTMLPDVRESEREIPARCHQEGMNSYVDFTDGFCFAYPSDFIHDPGGLSLVTDRPKKPFKPEEALVRLDIFSAPALSDDPLEKLVSEFRQQFEGPNSPVTMRQTQIILDGEPAVVLEPVPGHVNSRIVFILHKGFFYQLTFYPIDEPSVESDLNRLYEAVTSTFTFIP